MKQHREVSRKEVKIEQQTLHYILKSLILFYLISLKELIISKYFTYVVYF